MSTVAVRRGGDARLPPVPGRLAAPVVVASAAAVVALALGGRGLLVPGGPTSALVRVGGALVGLGAVAVLVRLDGPARGARTLTLVAVVGALTGLATLPASPVSLDEAGTEAPTADGGAPAEEGGGTVWFDRAEPGAEPGGGTGGVLELPPGAALELDGDEVILRLPDGSSAPLGRADGAAAPGTPPAAGARSGVAASPAGGGRVVVTRTDGGPLGPDVPLGGMAFESRGGRRVVVGDGALLEVPDPLPTAPDAATDDLADGVEAVLALLLAGFALLAFAPPVVRVAGRVVDPAPVADPPAPLRRLRVSTVEEGLADVLRAMLADPDPRTAVIGAYARLLVALGEVGFGRRPEEAPHEHLWRALGPLGVRRGPVHRLAELFVRARFTPRPVTEEHRRAAIEALADAVGDLRLQAGDVDTVTGATAEVGA